jgi:tetratricopeptide (TPR) repeat protein
VDPLDDSAMAVLLDGLVPGMPAEARTAIAKRAEGIPLYAVETVRMLIDRDVVQPVDGVYRLVGDVGRLGVPVTLQSLLAARLDALAPDARTLIADAAVLGTTFPAEALVAVSDLPEPEVRRLLTELVRREVLGVRADPLSPQRGHYGFVQSMFRQVAYDTLSRRDRKRRHLTVAAHLEQTFTDNGEEIAEVIAAHLIDALAALPDDPDVPELRERAVAILVRAGERAERTGAPAAAAAAYSRAAQLLTHPAMASPDAERAAAALHERAGEAASTAGDSIAAVESWQQAGDVYRRHELPRDAARTDVGVGRTLRAQGRFAQAREALERALLVLEHDPDIDTVGALLSLAALHMFGGHPADADRAFGEALTHAQAIGASEHTMADLCLGRGLAYQLDNRRLQASAYLREAVRRAEAAQATTVIGGAFVNLADLLVLEDPAAAAEAAEAAIAHCRRVGDRFYLDAAVGNLIQALLLEGRWDAATDVYARAVQDDDLAGEIFFDAPALLLNALRGDDEAVSAILPRLEVLGTSENPQELGIIAMARALVATRSQLHAEALEHCKEALRQGEAFGVSTDVTRWTWPMASDNALATGDVAEATRLIDWLDEHPPGHIPPVLRAEQQRIRARLLAVTADPRTSSAFTAAVGALRDLGSPYHLAVGLLDQAEFLMAEHHTAADGPMVGEARTIAARLGARPLLDRVDRLTDGQLRGADQALRPSSRT